MTAAVDMLRRLFWSPATRLLLPALAFMLAFLALPWLNLLELSVLRHSSVALWVQEFTLENYALAVDPYYIRIFWRSLKITLIVTALCIALGYPVAYYLARCSGRALSIGMFLLLMPLMVSIVVLAFGWIVMLGRSGLLNQFLVHMGLDTIRIIYTETAVIVALVQLVLPLMVLPLMASIERIDPEIEEAAINLGSPWWYRFWRVILPMSIPGLISGIVLCFAMAISVVVVPALLGGRGGRMIGNEIYDQVLTGLNWPLASALAVLVIFAILLLLGAAALLARSLRARDWEASHG